MSNKLIEAFLNLHSINSSNLFEAAKKAKKLDPVGKEDDDIDNDGDKDKSDSYLHNRRKAIKAAMKEAIDPAVRPRKDPNAEGIAAAGQKAPDMTTKPEYETKPDGVNRSGKSSLPQSVSDKMKGKTDKLNTEEVEYIDEAAGGLPAEHKKAITNHVKKMWGKGAVTFDKQDGKHFVTHNDGIQSQVHSIHMKGGKAQVTHFMTVNEEVEFSEAELAHFAAILEANPIAPVPDDYSGAAGGVSKRDLSDETVAEEEVKRGRGRPKGSKSGSKHGGGSSDTAVEPKNLAAQIRFASSSGANDGKGNMMLKHPKTGVTKAVPAKAATEFYNKYSSAEKPAQKQAHHDEFLAKHFGGESKPKTGGITLPKMPASKS